METPGEAAELYVSKNQNPATRAMVVFGKRALGVAKAMLPASYSPHLIKFKGMVTTSWLPFIKVVPREDDGFQVQFIDSRLPQGFNKSEFGNRLQEALAYRVGGGDADKWV